MFKFVSESRPRSIYAVSMRWSFALNQAFEVSNKDLQVTKDFQNQNKY